VGERRSCVRDRREEKVREREVLDFIREFPKTHIRSGLAEKNPRLLPFWGWKKKN